MSQVKTANNNAYKLEIELEPEYSLSEFLSLARSGLDHISKKNLLL